MKRKFRLLSILVIFALLMSLNSNIFPTSKADTTNITASDPQAEYRVEFDAGIGYASSTLQNNLQAVSSNLNEIVFTVDAGDDIFTIGYYLGDEKFSMETINRGIVKAVKDLQESIATEERISSNNNVLLSELELNYITVRSSENSISDVVSTLSNVNKINQLTYFENEDSLSAHNIQPQNNTRSSYSIDGSYHYYEIIAGTAYKRWYNQVTGTNSMCATPVYSPHEGDGNNRYASGYQWFPNYVDVSFRTDVTTDENRTWLWYKYNQNTLNNLNVDSNEALEMEVVFYNYNGSSTSLAQRGNAYQLIKSGSTWVTNQPNSYRDTNVSDNQTEVSFCVGVDDTSALQADTWYYWYIHGTKGTTTDNYPYDGKFKVVAQRSYSLLGSGAWSVFAEEHEPIRKLGLESQLSWVSDSAWLYATNNDDWNFDSSTDPVK